MPEMHMHKQNSHWKYFAQKIVANAVLKYAQKPWCDGNNKNEKLRKNIWCHKMRHIARFYIQVSAVVYICLSLNSTNTYCCIFHIFFVNLLGQVLLTRATRYTSVRERNRNCVLNERKKQRNMHECLFPVRFHSWCKNKVHNSRTNETDHSLCKTKRLNKRKKNYITIAQKSAHWLCSEQN